MGGARAHARRARDEALRAVAPLGSKAEMLAAIACYVVDRADQAAARTAS
jgi:hypothetical protein